MNFYSTNSPATEVLFKEAIFNSLPQDRGLYMPVSIPKLDADFIDNIDKYSLPQIAFTVAKTLLTDAIPEEDLKAIIDDAINFDAPVVKLEENIYVLELFHGPSLAFKDFGARFMSRVMSHFLRDGEQLLDILVATSGDTGGAVALGFLSVPNTRVTILYPKGKVSPIQEQQLTTNGKNIRAIEVNGTFDDCQAMVKQAFTDTELNRKFRLTSANPINIARLIPQTFYYFNAYAQLLRQGKKDIIFSVPSGNFGNISAGLLAWKLGLPVKQFIAATNANDTVPAYLNTGLYKPKPSVQTLSNAMDVGNPSNWVRIAEMFKENASELNKLVKGVSYTDEQTIEAIKKVHAGYQYVVCPHTAIAWQALKDYKAANPQDNSTGVFLATAHACKFPDVFPAEVAGSVVVPQSVKEMQNKLPVINVLGNDFEQFKWFLKENA